MRYWLSCYQCASGRILCLLEVSLPVSSANEAIVIRGARTHNLKNISCEIPHGKLTVVSGVSGIRQESRWPSTRSMPRGSGGTSSRCRHTRGSFWSGSKSRMWTRSTGLLRPSPSSRRTRRAIRARPWPRPLRSTTICVCSMRDAARCIASIATDWSSATRWTRSPSAMLALGEGTRLHALFPVRHEHAAAGTDEAAQPRSAQKRSGESAAKAGRRI